ncbi:uncharacterized protein LOC143279444 [Babylonia areolata]|uniref:uncharacterized protein LOC143279444 n=1 Tax=Babylonia areolata TaxID=304850 RepID=UPI003FD14AC4
MMQMQDIMYTQSEDFPSAIVLARLADVVVNNNVLYRMIQPTEQGTEVVSVNRMVNVVPFRRVYRFERKEELNEFCNELLKRPLVLQPIVHFGRGLGSGSLTCGMCYKDDKWVMLVNQTHPKILGRLQIGLDAAKSALARGQSCEIRFAFSQLVEKLYKESLTRKEQENAAETLDLIKSYFRYAEWEYGDLVITYHGYAARFGRGGGLRDMQMLKLSFTFEDLMTMEISWKTLGAEFFPKPHLAPVTEDEIRESLPAWTVNGVSPLENIGEQVPAANYSYSQAGRLYESFRKKKRRPRAEMGDQAEGGAPTIRPAVTDGIELKVMGYEDVQQLQQHSPGGGRYMEEQPDCYHGYNKDVYNGRVDYNARGTQPPTQQRQGFTEDDGFYEGQEARPKRSQQHDSHGHIYPDVRVNPRMANEPDRQNHPGAGSSPTSYPYTNAQPATSPYERAPHGQMSRPYASTHQNEAASPYSRPTTSREEHEYTSLKSQFPRLHMHGSDRSSHSEAGSGAADSGICSDSDGHAREGSYDKSYPSVQKHSPKHPYAMDNPGFHDDDQEVGDALRKHKELVAKMMGGAQLQTAETGRVRQKSGHEDIPQQRHQSGRSDRSGGDHLSRSGYSPPYAKGSVPSPLSLQGQHYENDRADSNNTHYSQKAYSPSARSPRLPVEESFI